MYKFFPFLFLSVGYCFGQHTVTGKVINAASGEPLPGASVSIVGSGKYYLTDKNGVFIFSLNENNPFTVLVKTDEFEEQKLEFKSVPVDSVKVTLKSKYNEIEAVAINTGYQKIPKERSTGSYSFVDNELIQQQTGSNILDRLPAVANGVTLGKGFSSSGQLMVRGLSSMQGPKSPLIVIDNFPYDGDINNIPPETIENITVLKDAAASSIWGARAANGVIVITTKKGRFNQPMKVNFNVTSVFSDKPDFGYLKTISSSDFIDVEKSLFEKGFYNNDINSKSYPVLTPVVDLLNKAKKGVISSEAAEEEINRLRTVDYRDQYKKYMYSASFNNQYYLSLSSGSDKISWLSSLSFDDNKGNLSESFQRLNLQLQNAVNVTKALRLNLGLNFTTRENKSGSKPFGGISMRENWQVPYLELADTAGNPLIVPYVISQDYKESMKNKPLLNWDYIPINDVQHDKVSALQKEWKLDLGLNYKILNGLDLDLKYQYLYSNALSEHLYDKDSYYARNYSNSYAQLQTDGSVKFILPKGAILDKSFGEIIGSNLRTQLNLNRTFGKNSINAIIGGEGRELVSDYADDRYYGYDVEKKSSSLVDLVNQYPLLVTGTMDFIPNIQGAGKQTTKFLSFYGNAEYSYDKRYSFSVSARRDASNLFGLNTNDQWNPFWSAGLGWQISNEKFYNFQFLPNLRFRTTYGFNGNIDPAMVAVTTIIYDKSLAVYSNTPQARINNYYNPDLKWETSRILNFGLDFSFQNKVVSGSVEYFLKKGSNLFGTAPIDYTSGVTTILKNVASMEGNGMDVEIRTQNINRNFKWNTILNLSTYKDKVKDYYRASNFARNYIAGQGTGVPISGIKGLPVYSIFAYKWAGLDPQTGDPQGYLDGNISKDYSKILGAATGVDDLQYFGSALPTTYGAIMNNFSFGQFSIDTNIGFKLGYWFRRASINYTNLYSSRTGHEDFAFRWQKSGDELVTNVPSNTLVTNSARDQFYNGSSVLVEKGDHIRINYIRLGYDFNTKIAKSLHFDAFNLSLNVTNVGLIWAANKKGIDPDFSWTYTSLKPPVTYSISLRTKF